MHKPGPSKPAPPSAPTFGKLRKREEIKRENRDDCSYRVALKSEAFSGTAQLVNISRTGMAVRTFDRAPHLTGGRITVTGPDVGVLHGTARWQRGNQIGVQFDGMTNTKARLKAYFSFFKK